MRLTAIRLAGFKSFVDRTELRLGSNLTAIVGPNGCGKSNLIDAVRWVLGESSARQLRGSSLEDVIFTGSRTRKPVGRASIELVFDNSDQTLGGQWGAYAEIAVRRELTRDGQSTFSINGQRCRRKDVTELFLGTGLGPRANYAIIEQGTISRLVEAQPDDLRQMIEEVAGVSRYKEKRRETETRIRHTRENLERLNDIITELDERLAKLKRQVGAAERYKAYRAEQRALRGAHFGLRWQDLAQQRHQGDALVKTAEEAVEQTRRAVADTMVALQGAEEAQAQVAALGRSADEAFYARQAELARIDQEMQHQQQLRSVRQQELAELQAEAKRLDARLQAARQEHVTTDDALSRVDQSLAEATAREANAEQGHSDASEHLAAAQAKLLDARQAAEAPRTAQAREQARAEQLQRQLDALQRREDTLRAELDGLNANAPDANLDSLQTQCQSLAQAQQQAQEAVDATQIRLQAAREGLKQSAEANRTQQAALSESRARYQVLKAEQERSLRADDQSLPEQLRAAGLELRGLLGERLQVPPGREVAVEAVLRDWLRAPLVDALPEQALPANAALLQGEVRQDAAAPEQRLDWGVSAPAAALRFLAAFEWAADAGAAQVQIRAGAQAVVAADGSMHWADAGRGAPAADGEGSVLLRQKALQQAESVFQAAGQKAEAAVQTQQAAQAELQQAEKAWAEGGQQLDTLRRERARADELLVRAEAALERHSKRLGDAQAQLQQGEQERAAAAAELDQVRERLHMAAAELSQASQQAQAAEEDWRQKQTASSQAQQQAQALRRELGSLRQQREELARRRAAAESAVASQTQGLEQIRLGMSRAEQALGELPAGDDLGSRREQAAAAFAEQQGRRQQVQQQLAEAARNRTQAQQALEQARSQNESAIQAVQEARLERERLSSRQDALVEQMDEQGLSPQRAIEAILPGQSLQAVQQELEELERKLARLGAVNLAAVEEYQEESARADSLRAQDADLRSALEQLETAMAQIDRETRALFRQTYSEVNQRFQARFPRLFGGGEAGLELLGDDVLSAGVRVMARPPGKRNASIALLSGGEKALTAVALVFALFELNPAPFCMLDEVDAPLDDANVVRFCEVVREMSAQVQFIVVTHNKVTMEMADALHGVTMQEAGVSRLVGVDVSAAVAMTEEPA